MYLHRVVYKFQKNCLNQKNKPFQNLNNFLQFYTESFKSTISTDVISRFIGAIQFSKTIEVTKNMTKIDKSCK